MSFSRSMAFRVFLIIIGFVSAIDGQGGPGVKDYCKLSPAHLLCPTQSRNSECGDNFVPQKITVGQKNLILYLHNELRSNLAIGKEKLGTPGPQPPAANMIQMEWDSELAEIAQAVADQCYFGHPCRKCNSVERFDVGQNLFKTSSSHDDGDIEWERPIRQWYSEVQNFNNSHVVPFIYKSEIGHFSQMVWWNTRVVGCGASKFKKDGWFMALYVCNYGPMGNRILSQMYEIGSPCNKCPNNSLCSEKYSGLCRFKETHDINLKLPTDSQFLAMADAGYLERKYPNNELKYKFREGDTDIIVRKEVHMAQIPAHIRQFLGMFFNHTIPQNILIKGEISSDGKALTSAPAGAAKTKLNFLLDSDTKAPQQWTNEVKH